MDINTFMPGDDFTTANGHSYTVRETRQGRNGPLVTVRSHQTGRIIQDCVQYTSWTKLPKPQTGQVTHGVAQAIHGVAQAAAKIEAATVGVKHDDGKLPLALLPFEALEAVARVLQFGAKKYAAHNWRGGFKWSRLFSAALRHGFAWVKGEDKDPETGESHLAHMACCILFLLTFVLESKGEDDRYKGYK